MIKLLHVIHVPFALTYFLGEQYSFLSENNIKPHIICSPGDDFDSYIESRDLVNVSKAVVISRTISPVQDIKSIFQICMFINKHGIDVVVGHSPKGALLSMIASFIMRVPKRIYFRHGLVYETANGNKRKLLVFIDKLTSFCATKVVCVSQSVLNKSLKDRLGPVHKHIVLGKGTCAGIDVCTKFNRRSIFNLHKLALRKSIGISPDKITLGFCGRLSKDKGIDLLIDAFLDLDKLYSSKYQLLLVGSLDERDPLENKTIDAINSNNHIFLTGLVSNDIEYYYSLFDIFILPSLREGFPTSVLEASSMELPVLTTRATGCIDSIIDGETGFFVDLNKDDIVQKIILLQDEILRCFLGVNGRKFVVDNFSNQKVWKEFVQLVKS